MYASLKNGSPRFARDDAEGVFLMVALSLSPRHCERLGKPRGNPCNTMCGCLKMDRHASLAMTRKLIVVSHGLIVSGFFDHHALSPPSLRAVYFITTPSLPVIASGLESRAAIHAAQCVGV